MKNVRYIYQFAKQTQFVFCTNENVKFEGSHPVVYGQLFTILVPSLHNI